MPHVHYVFESVRLRDSSRLRRLLAHFLVFALGFRTVWAVLRAFHSSLNWMDLVQDDFFYYVKVAENIAAGHGSTFNGVVTTNGYHPLWLWVLSGAIRLGGNRAIPILLGFTLGFATLVTFFFARLLLQKSGIEYLLATALSVFASIFAFHVYCYGMEVSLAVPAMLGLMVYLQSNPCFTANGKCTHRSGFLVGLLSSIMVLARLDTIIFAILIAVFVLVQAELRRRITYIFVLGLAAGLLPLIAYFFSNRLAFGVWMPISGMAKQLKLDHGFTSLAWRSFDGLGPIQLTALSLIFTALIAFPFVSQRLKPIERSLMLAALVFPFVYTTTLSWLSDWTMWVWYMYTYRTALIGALVILFCIRQVRATFTDSLPLVLLVLIAFVALKKVSVPFQQAGMVQVAREIKKFSEIHPGIYAMGDRSGSVGYILQYPLIQTEGLVMDKNFLKLIANQTPLREVLSMYGVQYYVGTEIHPYDGCFRAAEPYQAGPHAPHMSGLFCEPPVKEWTADGVKTLIFEVGKSTALPERKDSSVHQP